MKIILNILSIIGALVVVVFLIGAFSTGTTTQSKYEKIKINENFDGSYNIDFGNSKCGNLGYQFKNNYETVFDETENPGRISKSNCKSINGMYQGYIFPSNKPNIRIYWQELTDGTVDLKK